MPTLHRTSCISGHSPKPWHPDCGWAGLCGFFIWVTLSSALDAKVMLPSAVNSGVAYVPGAGFFADGNGQNNIRLSYCYPAPACLRDGVRRLANMILPHVELGDTRSELRSHTEIFHRGTVAFADDRRVGWAGCVAPAEAD